ncbi:MAG: SGNH/GDSL hydrolase family protein [Limisphaerales bacterium]
MKSAMIRWILSLLLSGTFVGRAGEPDLLNPLPPINDGPEKTVAVPLRPPPPAIAPGAANAIRVGRPRPPAFELKDGDRVVWLGDRFLGGEVANGYLETRLTTQYPDRRLTFRPLLWLTNHPLAQTREFAGDWLQELLAEVAATKPTVAIIGYGTTMAQAGPSAVPAFRTNYMRLIEGLKSVHPTNPIRLVLLTPNGQPSANADEALSPLNDSLKLVAEVIRTFGTNDAVEVVDLFAWSMSDGAFVQSEAAKPGVAFPELTEGAADPSPYGWIRLTFGLERGLGWAPATWRLGYLADGSLRGGGFGVEILERHRSAESATLKLRETRLPPSGLGAFDDPPNSRPQCYMQVSGFNPGVYELQVDGRPILRGSNGEWARYVIVGKGPSWDQTDQVRRLIVEKNRLFLERWNPEGRARKESTLDPATVLADEDAPIQELEKTIAQLKRPVDRRYEIKRVGDAQPR